MATEDIRISQPVEIKTDSEARVAYDLMIHIAHYEEKDSYDRDYWLKLYLQCRCATQGHESLQEILELK